MRIGEALAGARRQADLTVTEVSERTRIRETIIRAIEDDDYSVCGGDFYARGHIRSIAKVVGTDPELLIRDYDAVHRAPGALSTVSLEELLASATEAPQRRGPDWTAGQERAAAARASLRRWPSLAAALVVLTGTTVRRWLGLAGELVVLTRDHGAALAGPGGRAGGTHRDHGAALAGPGGRAGGTHRDHGAAQADPVRAVDSGGPRPEARATPAQPVGGAGPGGGGAHYRAARI